MNEKLIHAVETQGVLIARDVHRFTVYDVDISFPYVILTLCTAGSARALYDMREHTQQKNELALIMPGHIMRPLECSDDYTYTRMAVSQKVMEGLRAQMFSHDYEKFHYNPFCTLTDIQVERLLTVVDQLALIASHTDMDIHYRNHILLAQLSVGYEYLNYYRREQDRQWASDPHSALFSQFCDLVVAHYREQKDISFYADQLHYHPKYLSRVIRTVTHGVTPGQWIEQYVVAQAKRLIIAHPDLSLKQIAFSLGFTEPTSFYRYFRRVTGITAKTYRDTEQ